jgi:membrane protease YdiL (CAAX protease family)
MFLVAIIVRKRNRFVRELVSGEKELDTGDDARTKGAVSKGPWRRIGVYLLVAVLGLLLDNFSSAPHYLPTIHSLPTYWSRLRSGQDFDLASLLLLILVSICSPIAQECFFRGAIYAYARQVGGVGFGLVFSALLFSGYHLDWVRFTALFWVGIIYATQYEVSRSLLPSVLTHSIGNFLISIRNLG